MRRFKNNFGFLFCDAFIIAFSLYFALQLKFDFRIDAIYIQLYKTTIIPLIILMVSFNILFNLYNNIWKYASIDELMSIIYSVTISNIIFLIVLYILSHFEMLNNIYYRFPYTVHIIFWMLTVILCGGIRFIFRIYYSNLESGSVQSGKDNTRLLIIGAGDAAVLLIREIKTNPKLNYKVVGLIDDDLNKQGKLINGIKVIGTRGSIVDICRKKLVKEIIIAIPSANMQEKKEIINICKDTQCKLRILPGINEVIDEDINLNKVRDVNIEDLLGREEVKLDNSNIKKYIKGKIVLVTGGGGSIGSELCRQIAKFDPQELLILDIYENNAYDLQMELNYSFPKLNKKVIIASIRDENKIRKIFEKYKPDVVFHAAAHKHVPLMEANPEEAIKNNILGTYNVVKLSHEYGVKKFVQISTDKAVNPTNIMGATKRFCEMLIQAFDSMSKTEYVAVRFGNVLGSNGSVIPLFKRQIAHGGPVTVTDPEINRFFMTIPEAAQLVIQAGAMARGGEIFVLDMGEPVKIINLARDLITLSGLKPDEDIKIEFTGLRPGEKLYEEILMNEIALTSTEHNKIFVERPQGPSMEFIEKALEEFRNVGSMQREDIFKLMELKVDTYSRKKN